MLCIAARVQQLHCDQPTLGMHRRRNRPVPFSVRLGCKGAHALPLHALGAGRQTASDNQRYAVAGTLGVERSHASMTVGRFFQTGVHRSHQHTVAQLQAADFQRFEQVWVRRGAVQFAQSNQRASNKSTDCQTILTDERTTVNSALLHGVGIRGDLRAAMLGVNADNAIGESLLVNTLVLQRLGRIQQHRYELLRYSGHKIERMAIGPRRKILPRLPTASTRCPMSSWPVDERRRRPAQAAASRRGEQIEQREPPIF